MTQKTQPKIRFTVADLKDVTCPPSGRPARDGRLWVPDGKVDGLGLRVTETGSKMFYLYRRVPGRNSPVKIKIGPSPGMSIDQARTAAARLNTEIFAGVDPVEKREVERARKEADRLE